MILIISILVILIWYLWPTVVSRFKIKIPKKYLEIPQCKFVRTFRRDNFKLIPFENKNLKVLTKVLSQDDQIVFMTSGFFNSELPHLPLLVIHHPALLVITQNSVILIYRKLFSQTYQYQFDDFIISSINVVWAMKFIFGGFLYIQNNSGFMHISDLPKKQCDQLVKMITRVSCFRSPHNFDFRTSENVTQHHLDFFRYYLFHSI